MDLFASVNWIIYWTAAAVFIVVEVLLIGSALRMRGQHEPQSPAPAYAALRRDLAWTLVPALLMLVIFVFAFQTLQGR